MATPGTSRARGILSHFTRHRTLANLLLVLMILAGVLLGFTAAPGLPDTIAAPSIWRVQIGARYEF